MRFGRIFLKVVGQMAAEVLSIFEVTNAISTTKYSLSRNIAPGIYEVIAILSETVAVPFVMVAEMVKAFELLLTVGTVPHLQQLALLCQVTKEFFSASKCGWTFVTVETTRAGFWSRRDGTLAQVQSF